MVFMKNRLTKICWPILKLFETDVVADNFKRSHRIALNVLGGLFILITFASAWAASTSDELAAFIPVVVFFCIGSVAVIVGALGSNGAVCKIWGTK
jgi:hypothetical protein